jgi:hypothetical protein
MICISVGLKDSDGSVDFNVHECPESLMYEASRIGLRQRLSADTDTVDVKIGSVHITVFGPPVPRLESAIEGEEHSNEEQFG